MDPEGATSMRNGVERRSADRLNQALIWLAVILTAVAVALVLDVISHPSSETAAMRSSEETSVALQSTPQPVATATPSPPPVTPPPCEAPPDWMVYTVQEGDTLYSLAERYDSDIDSIKRVNCLEGNTIYVNQNLSVPDPNANVALGGSEPADMDTSQSPSAVDVRQGFPEHFVNIILLGSDKREASSTWRTDTMILLSVDTEGEFVRLLSIPRDLWVDIPGHGYDRINTADLWGELTEEGGGPDLVKRTIQQNLGIPIHYYVRVDFDGFIKIIDAIGGLDIDVECPLSDIELEAGMHHMDGEDALLYARSRITTSDFDRSRRQRKLLMALWEQGLDADIIPRLPALWMAMKDTFQTDLPLDQVISLAYVGLQLRPNRIMSQSIGPWQVQNWITPQGAAVLVPIDEAIQEMLNSFYSPPNLEFLEKIGRTRVQILNGSQIPDAEQLAASTLHWAGFQVSSSDLSNSRDYSGMQIFVHNAAMDVAEAAAQLLDAPPSAIQYESDPSSQADISIILGWDYDPCDGN
jgi:LCP family protein required for cell wall assembly